MHFLRTRLGKVSRLVGAQPSTEGRSFNDLRRDILSHARHQSLQRRASSFQRYVHDVKQSFRSSARNVMQAAGTAGTGKGGEWNVRPDVLCHVGNGCAAHKTTDECRRDAFEDECRRDIERRKIVGIHLRQISQGDLTLQSVRIARQSFIKRAVLALTQQDMLSLRSCMVCASACGIAFNLLQPRPLFAPAAWGAFFVAGHCLMIGLLLRERQAVSMRDDEMGAYEETFHQHGFTPRQFKRLVEAGKWEHHAPGSELVKQGESARFVYYVHRGGARVETHGEEIGNVGEGSRFIGSMHDIGTQTWPFSVRATEPCVVIKWPMRQLRDMVRKDAKMLAAADSTAIQDLSRKLALHSQQVASRRGADAYRGMLHIAVSDGRIDGVEKRALRLYRESHGLTHAEHLAALHALGWSETEFDDGVQADPERHYMAMLSVAVADGHIDVLEKRALRVYRESHRISAERHAAVLAELGWSAQEYDDGVQPNCALCETANADSIAPYARYDGAWGRLAWALDSVGIGGRERCKGA